MSLSTSAKLTSSLLYVLSEGGSMEIMRLGKLLYLTDYLYAKTFGNKSGFMGGHARFEFGPLPGSFYPTFNHLLEKHAIARNGNIISLTSETDTSVLDEKELACLDKVIEDFKGLSLNKVKKAAYATEPMVSIQEEEARQKIDKMLYAKMDFNDIDVHPLLDNADLDTSFMEDPEFQKNLR